MMASLSDNSLRQYDSALRKWFEFCLSNNINFYDASVPNVLYFLTEIYNKGSQYGTLNSTRSALSLILGPNMSKDDRIIRFLKGVYRLRPPQPKYNTTWDTSLVLQWLSQQSPNENLTLEMLTKKCVCLLALTTAHRMQTLSKIMINNIEIFNNKIIIKIPDHIKTSRPGSKQPILMLPFYDIKPDICPCKTLIAYINKTKTVRGKHENLFISFKKPFNPVTTQSLSRWVKSVLRDSGIDTSLFSAHSTRHAATSKAHQGGVSVDTIRNTANWSESSNVFGKFYNKVIINPSDTALATAVLSDSI